MSLASHATLSDVVWELADLLRQKKEHRTALDMIGDGIDQCLERLAPLVGPDGLTVLTGASYYEQTILRLSPDGLTGITVETVKPVLGYQLEWPKPVIEPDDEPDHSVNPDVPCDIHIALAAVMADGEVA